MANKSIKKLADTIIKVVDERLNQKPKSYDTQAVVRRIDTQTGEAFVHIPNGIDETPVRLTIDAAVGDTVQVRVADGKAWLTGNRTAPPTDDTTARVAQGTAAKAEVKAEQAEETANAVSGIANSALSQAAAAKQIADDTEQHFWFTETGTDTGAHITEVTQEEWNDSGDPNYQSGGNLLARSNGIAVRNGLAELASFGSAGAVIGQNASGKSRTEISTSGMQILQNVNGVDTQIAHLGYASNAPYYTLGKRNTLNPLGNYSMAEGLQTTASGVCSHSEGNSSTASGDYSHAEGYDTTAVGFASHTQNEFTVAGYDYQTAIGRYNENKASNLFEIGNGGNNQRSNAFEVSQTGNITASGDITTHGKLTAEAVNVGKLYDVESYSINVGSSGATGAQSASESETKTGYIPLGVVGFNVVTGGAYSRGAYLTNRGTNSCTINARVQANTAGVKSCTVYVLWMKNAV